MRPLFVVVVARRATADDCSLYVLIGMSGTVRIQLQCPDLNSVTAHLNKPPYTLSSAPPRAKGASLIPRVAYEKG